MRTKALLCAVAVAAGAVSTMAQSNVYSLNIVGYANVTFPAGNYLYVNPLNKDGTNSAAQVLPSLPDNTLVSLWTGSGYDVYLFDSSLGIDPRNWYDSSGSVGRDAPILPPGKGFFANPQGPFTNTFVGDVVPAPGVTNTLSVPAGNQLIGSVLPVGGSVTNAIWNFPQADNTLVSRWTGSGYDVYLYDGSLGIDPRNWYDSSGSVGRDAPSFDVGQSFFFNAQGPVQWKQWLP